jgi:hypothetical protein
MTAPQADVSTQLQLSGGAYRRFRARAIRGVERAPARTELLKPPAAVSEHNHTEGK